MTVPLPLLPDSLAVAREALLAQASLTALVGTRIYDAVPASPVWPLLVITPVVEDEVESYAGQARMQVDVWGAGPTSAHKQATRGIVSVLISVLRDLRGSYASGRIYNSALISVVPLPDPETGRQRVAVDFLIHTHSL